MSLSSSTRSSSQGSRAAGRPAAGGTTRLPSGRERRPALAALAVILILLGAAGSALIALNSGNRSDFVAISADALPPGHKIESKDFSRGDLAGATGGLIPWSEAEKYVGRYTTSWLYKDQFVTPANFTKDGQAPIPAGGALVGVSLEAGRAPSDGLKVGDIVTVIRVPSANQEGAATPLVSAAEVTSSAGAITDSKTSANSSLNVTILIPSDKVNPVAAAAAAKTLVLVKLSPGTKPEVSRNGGSN
ncbi:hypothetical protein [Kribbella sp. HUAS MG21]|uniref:SAF domain-containing protein n=1 Tax=Kribbella sp. HUAS MG21 TaxID=3160966 RepID=A0AAU7TAD6_9ACTN